MDPEKLKIVRSKDALRKRRWRLKKKLERDGIADTAISETTIPIVLNASPIIAKTEEPRADLDNFKAADRLKEIRSKDAERKRRARARKRQLMSLLSVPDAYEAETAETSAKPFPETSDGNEKKMDVKTEEEVPEQSGFLSEQSDTKHFGSLTIDVDMKASGDCLPSDVSSPGLCHPSPSGASKCCSRMPRKYLSPEQLKELRARDNERKRYQRWKKRLEQQQQPGINPLDLFNDPNILATMSMLMMCSPTAFTSPGAKLDSVDPIALPDFSTEPSPSTSESMVRSVSPETAEFKRSQTPVPNETISSIEPEITIDLIKGLLAEVVGPKSPQLAALGTEEKAAARRAARSARKARLTAAEKEAIRASDRERKRLWRMKQKGRHETTFTLP
ncbi:unnamed protein product, partial [Mesorhabditis spiculigera]